MAVAATYHKQRDEGCCSVQFLKYVLFIFNFVFMVAGCAVLGVGLWTVIDKHTYVPLLSTNTYPATAYMLITAGALVLIVTMIGCVAILREDRCLLLVYTFMLLLIFLLEAVAGVIAYVYEEQVWTELEENLNNTFVEHYGYDEQRTMTIDKLQREFKCCGAVGFEDWRHSLWKKNNPEMRNKVPDSCCRSETPDCGQRDHPSNIYPDGCIRALDRLIKEHVVILGAVGLGISLVQVFGMIFSCCLYIQFRTYREDFL